MNRQNHIIHRLELEINTSLEQKAYVIKDHIGDFLNTNVFPKLEKLLDELVTEKQLIRFDQLDLDLRTEKWNDSASILNQIERQIRMKIDGVANFPTNENKEFGGKRISEKVFVQNETNGTHLIKREQNYSNIFLEFLTFGILPWYAGKEQVHALLIEKNWNKLLEIPSFVSRVNALISKDENTLQRFVNQVPLKNILLLLVKAEVVHPDRLKELQFNLEKFSTEFRCNLITEFLTIWISGLEKRQIQFKQLAKEYKKEQQKIEPKKNLSFTKWFYSYLNKKGEHEELSTETQGNTNKKSHDLIEERWQFVQLRKNIPENNPTINSSQKAATEREEEPLNFVSVQHEWIVQNAGQVLFHPFIRLLFRNSGWVNGQGILKDEFRAKAVQILHYCNTGKDNFFEPDLLLEKFLCGIPFHHTVPFDSLLTRNLKRQATFMVKDVIRNWPELKNTTPGGLRDAFIRRSGKLVKNENGYKLIVERKVQDVLLEKLNWNISIIKMPWQKEILFVEW